MCFNDLLGHLTSVSYLTKTKQKLSGHDISSRFSFAFLFGIESTCYMPISQKKEDKMKTGQELKSGKACRESQATCCVQEAPQSVGTAEGTRPANATCLLPGSGRGTPLKAAGFRSRVALGENGIKG